MAFFFLCLYTIFLIFRPQDFVPGLQDVPLMLVFLASATFLTLWRRDFGLHDVPSWSILILFGVMMVSSIANGWTGGAVRIAMEFGPIVATYFVYSHELRDPGRIRRICQVILACTLIMVFHSIGQAATGIGWTGARAVEGSRVTWVGIFNDPNDLALMFLIAIPLAVMMARVAKARWLSGFWYAVAIMHIYGIFLTGSRGAVLTLLLMASIMAYRNLSKGKLVLAMGLAVPILVYASSSFRTIDISGESAEGRIEAWYTAIQLFKDNPFLGVGMNNFTEYNRLTAHNSYLLILSELGLLGYLFWTLMIASSGLMVWYVSLSRPVSVPAKNEQDANRFNRPVKDDVAVPPLVLEGQMTLYALVGYLSAAFFLSRSYIVVLYMICGMAVALYHRARLNDTEIPEVSGRALVGFLAVFVPGSLVFLYLTVKFLL